MSLWRVRHGLSPVAEAALLALAACLGVLAIWLASVRPFAYPATIAIRNLAAPVSLDTDTWSRSANGANGYEYGVPSGWVVDAASSTHLVIARSHLGFGPSKVYGARLVVDVRPLAPHEEASNVAAVEFVGQQPALYDVGVAGREGLFAIAFDRRHVGSQAVYVPKDGLVYIFRGDGLNPAVFSAFISTIRFFTP